MIEVDDVRKCYGRRIALDGVSFAVKPGQVTGFLGPNGAGKTTTLRIILGLEEPESGRTRIGGIHYRDAPEPIRAAGALLDARWVHPARSARTHLSWIAAAHGISRSRVDEVLELTGLGSVARRPAGRFSLGMSQRLGIAAALLGDPAVLILDEPVNGLDPEGVLWLRTTLRDLADEGRTVFLSSHLMSEMALLADHLVVLGGGRVLKDAPLADVLAEGGTDSVTVRTPESVRLGAELAGQGAQVATVGEGELRVAGMTAAHIGDVAARIGVPLHHLAAEHASLEDVYFRLTGEHIEYRAGSA